MSTETIILIGVAVYVVIMIALGIYASTKSHTVTEFAVAGRSLPLWLCTATVIATWFGGSASPDRPMKTACSVSSRTRSADR